MILEESRRRSTGRSLEYSTAQQQAYRRSISNKTLGIRPPPLGRPFQISSSLPSHHATSVYDRIRPEFRKSSSQPSRSLSPPPSLHFASPSHEELYLHPNKPLPTTPTDPQSFHLKKRRLPQVPLARRSSKDQMSLSLGGRSKQWKGTAQQRRSTDALTSVGTYSDSEITARSPYDRLFYAHPTRQPSQRGRSRRESEIPHHHHMYPEELGGDRERRDSRGERSGQRGELGLHRADSRHHHKGRSKKRDILESGEDSETSVTSINSAFSNISERHQSHRRG